MHMTDERLDVQVRRATKRTVSMVYRPASLSLTTGLPSFLIYVSLAE